MRRFLLLLACVSAAAGVQAKSRGPAKPAADKPVSYASPVFEAPTDRQRVAQQLWKLGLGYFASGDAELARVEWFACAELDASNESCRQGLEGLKRLSSLPASQRSPAVSALPAPRPEELPQARNAATARMDPREAEARARVDAERRDRHSAELQVQAMAALAHGETDRARDLYAACRELSPKNAECADGLARVAELKAAAPPLPAAAPAGPQLLAGAKDAAAANPPLQAASAASPDEARRQAIRHWNTGIVLFQRGDFAAAKQEWSLCQQADPSNLDCQTGLQRIQASGGGR